MVVVLPVHSSPIVAPFLIMDRAPRPVCKKCGHLLPKFHRALKSGHTFDMCFKANPVRKHKVHKAVGKQKSRKTAVK